MSKIKITPMNISGFSLLELLIVVGIIALLASLLMPAVQAARNSGYTLSCIGNLKQLGLAFQMYANDNNGLLPHFDRGGVGNYPEDCCWYDSLDAYLSPNNNLSKVKQCPSAKDDHVTRSYKMNIRLEDNGGPIYFRRVGTIAEPCRTVLLFDGKTSSSQFKGLAVADRHKNGANILFCDGHVKWYLKQDLESWGTTSNSAPVYWGN